MIESTYTKVPVLQVKALGTFAHFAHKLIPTQASTWTVQGISPALDIFPLIMALPTHFLRTADRVMGGMHEFPLRRVFTQRRMQEGNIPYEGSHKKQFLTFPALKFIEFIKFSEANQRMHPILRPANEDRRNNLLAVLAQEGEFNKCYKFQLKWKTLERKVCFFFMNTIIVMNAPCY